MVLFGGSLNSRRLFSLLLFMNITNVALQDGMPNSKAPKSVNGTTVGQRESRSKTGFFINIYVIIIMSVLSVILNGLLLLVFTVDPLRCLRNISSSLIVNLALADLLTGITILIWATEVWPWQPLLMSNIIYSLIWLGYTASFLTITLLSCERFVAIKYIWSADSIVTKERTTYGIITIWLLASTAFINISPKYRNIYNVSLSTIFEFCVFLVIGFYFRLWRIRRENSRQESDVAVKQEMKLTVVVFLILVILVITTLPLMVIYQILFIVPRVCNDYCLGKAIHKLPLQFFPVFTLNFGLNPVIYAWRLPKYRRSFHKLYSLMFKNSSEQRSNNYENGDNRRSTIVLSQFGSGSIGSLKI